VKDQDVDEAHGRFVILRDEEVSGLDMVTTDEDLVLRGD